MVLSYTADGSVVAKTKSATLTLGSTLKIENFEIPGAGEYDVSSVHCEGANLDTAKVFWFRTEDLSLGFLTGVDTELTKRDEAANTDILIVDLRSDASADALKTILKKVEPAYLFLTGTRPSAELVTALGLPKYESSTLKVVRGSLPMEGTSLVLPD